MQLLLGEAEGRVRVSVGGLPRGVMAVTVPKVRDGEPRLPKDRHGLLRPDEVDLIADGPVDAFEPPNDLPVRHLIFVLRRDAAIGQQSRRLLGAIGHGRRPSPLSAAVVYSCAVK
jgi:hypothetical protein